MCALPRIACAFIALSLLTSTAKSAEDGSIEWDQLPDLPSAAAAKEQKGLAGLFGGIHDGVLILAGGANFPDAVPWKNGVKSYWNDIYVLEKDASGKGSWVKGIKTKLPKPVAYGASVGTERGVICIGGADGSQCYTDVFLLKWNKEARNVVIEELPPLPVALAHATAAKIGSVVYVAGGIPSPGAQGTMAFFALDLDPQPQDLPEEPDSDPISKDGESASTEEKPAGDPETNEKSASEIPDTNGKKSPSGDTEEPQDPSNSPEEAGDSDSAPKEGPPSPDKSEDPDPAGEEEEKEVPKADPGDDPEEPKPIKPEVIEEPMEPIPLEWKELTPWDGEPRAFAVSAAQSDGEKECFFLFSGRNPKPDGTSQLLSDAHKYDPKADQWVRFPDVAPPDEKPRGVVAASASANGERSILIFGGDDGTMAKVSSLVVAAANSTSKDAYLKLNETILENHPGFSRDVLALDTIDGVWRNIATFPESCPVTTPAILWDKSFVIPSGEVRPGVRSAKIWRGTWKPK